MNTQHTPGPWKVDAWNYDDHRGTVLTIQTKSDAIAQICNLYRPEDPAPAQEEAANARLLAASPELLEALRKIEGYLYEAQSDIPEEYRAKRDVVSAMTIARSAIAKATQP